MARAAAAVHKKKPQTRLLALLALSWACLQTAQPVRALAGPTVRCSSRPSSSTSSSISTGPHRQLRPLRVSPRRAVQASEPSESEDDKDKIVASARDEQLQKTAQEKEDKGFDESTEKETLLQKLPEMAVKTWDGAQKDLDGAREDLDGAREDRDFARQRLREAVQNGDEKERKEAREEFEKAESKVGTAKEEAKRAESKVQTAKEEATKAREELEKAKSTAPLQDPLAILESNEVSASDLQAIKAQLRQPLSRNLHTEPNDAAYVTHENTSKEFLQTVRMMHESFKLGRLNKVDSALLEYATMSGAGKTRWGFQVERLLRQDENFEKSVILRVGLNFNGGSGGGDADRTEAVYLLQKHGFSLQQIMASLLFARGLLERSPDEFRGQEKRLQRLRIRTVLDALFAGAQEADTRILVVHLDELDMLLKETSFGFTDRSLKELVNNLADYNCGEEPLGLVVPVITHTSPVKWDPEPTNIPLKRMNLGAFSFNQSIQFFAGIDVTDLDSRRAISACGGHAALLVEMRKFMKRRSGGLGPLFTCSRLELHQQAVKATVMSKEASISLLKVILLQEVVSEGRILGYSQRGLILLERDGDGYRVSVPYPYLLNLLRLLDRPKRFEHLEWTGNTPAKNSWTTKAFEALCAVRIAIEMEDFPYDSPCDPHSVATAFRTENKSRVCLAKKQNQAGVDAIGVHGDMMTLLQCKYPEMDSTAQEWKEVEQFMNFTEKTGVNWANSAGCNQIRAIFATGRAPRDYTSRRPTELEVDGVHISYTVYAKTENRRGCAIRAMPISTWIPASIMCF